MDWVDLLGKMRQTGWHEPVEQDRLIALDEQMGTRQSGINNGCPKSIGLMELGWLGGPGGKDGSDSMIVHTNGEGMSVLKHLTRGTPLLQSLRAFQSLLYWTLG